MTTLPAGTARPVAPAAAPSERAVLVAVALGAMLMPLNSTMVAVALPDVGHSFHDGIAAVSWLVTSYLIAMAALQPVAGKLGDRLGRRPLVLGGLWAFGVASVIAPAAPSLAVLIALRVAQAAAGALVFPNAMALLRELLPEHRRAAGFGMFGAAIGIAAAAGPPIGGLLVGLFGWQGIFAVNVPMVAAALVLGRRALVARPRPAGVSAPFDALGAGLLCVVLADVALLLNPGAIGSGGRAAAAVALLPLLVLFARRELGHPDPVLQPRLLRRVPFAAATAGVGLSNL
ncbi:MAG TPA: MFS transporter, partial [Solirubrobacteraceae bacterium]|nr:MFS transporter [Solirubrobacteraceae bacterium]